MNKHSYVLVALLSLAVSGLAWAAPPTVPPSDSPVPALEVCVDAPQAVVGAPLEAVAVAENPGCRIACRETWGACLNACPGGLEYTPCKQACTQTLSACLDGCWGK